MFWGVLGVPIRDAYSYLNRSLAIVAYPTHPNDIHRNLTPTISLSNVSRGRPTTKPRGRFVTAADCFSGSDGPATISTQAQEIALVGMERRAGFDLKAVLTAIGAELRQLHSDVLREPIPDRMAALLKQLDEPMESSQDTDNA